MNNEEFLQLLERAVASGPEAFEGFLKDRVTSGLHWRQFDAMIGYLEDLPETEPELALVLSQILLDFFPEDEHADPSHRGMAWYFRIMALFQRPEPELFLKSLGQALDYCESAGETQGGFLICRNAKIMIRPGLAGEDTLLLLYQRIAAFFKAMGEAGEALDFLLSAASIFSRQGAYQPAERLLFEADKLAKEQGQDAMREVDAAFGKMAFDRQDHGWAESIFEELIESRRQANLPVSDQELFNLAVVKMRLKKTDAAYQLFTDIAARAAEKTILKFSAPLHQAICLKDMGDWAGAESAFAALQAEADELAAYEQEDRDVEVNDLLIEYELIYSLITAVNAKPSTAIYWLNKAVFRIEDAMQFTVRPHYRKRIRSQYDDRLLHVMVLISTWAKPADLLPALVALKKTTQSDWLAILAWAEYVEGLPQIPPAEKLKLKRIITKLHEHSGMILGAEKEQTDDPFLTEVSIETLSAPDNDDVSNLPFQDLALLAGELIQHYGLRPVFDFSSLPVLTELLADRLDQKYVLVFVFKANNSYINFILNERSVYNTYFETIHFKAYREALLDYRGNKIPWTTFEKQLTGVVEFIDEQLSPIWDELPMTRQKGIYIFSGVDDAYFPLPQACLANTFMRQRLGTGDFALLQCPIMFPQQQAGRNFERMQVLINKQGALGLFEPEAGVVAGYFPFADVLPVTSDKDLQKQLDKINNADLVHIITHGSPISRFADLALAGLAGEIFNIDTLKAFHDAKSQLYFISACNAADTANPPAGETIATNEIIGYTTVLMQNRTAQVIGAKWPLLDQIGFIFANIFYKILAETGDIQKAYGQTVYLLATEKSAFFLPFAEQLASGVVRDKLIAEIESTEKPFDLVFYYATLNLYSLI